MTRCSSSPTGATSAMQACTTAAPDWLITGVNGEQYACKHDVFMKTYVAVDDEASRYIASLSQAEVSALAR